MSDATIRIKQSELQKLLLETVAAGKAGERAHILAELNKQREYVRLTSEPKVAIGFGMAVEWIEEDFQ